MKPIQEKVSCRLFYLSSEKHLITWNSFCFNNKNIIMKKTFLMLAVIFLSLAAFAQKPAIVSNNKAGWHKIGETTVDFKSDKDELLVLGADKFQAIRVKVTDAPIHLQDLQAVYENDTHDDFQVRADFQKGGESRVIDLNGDERKLKKIIFYYSTIPNWKGTHAHVELFGLK